jgi:hypothetical protein
MRLIIVKSLPVSTRQHKTHFKCKYLLFNHVGAFRPKTQHLQKINATRRFYFADLVPSSAHPPVLRALIGTSGGLFAPEGSATSSGVPGALLARLPCFVADCKHTTQTGKIPNAKNKLAFLPGSRSTSSSQFIVCVCKNQSLKV